MSAFAQKLKRVLGPTATPAWLDVLLLILSGSMMGLVLWANLSNSLPEGYACAGPGFVDFGCTGGWAALASTLLSILPTLFIIGLFAAAGYRLLYRMRRMPVKAKQ